MSSRAMAESTMCDGTHMLEGHFQHMSANRLNKNAAIRGKTTRPTLHTACISMPYCKTRDSPFFGPGVTREPKDNKERRREQASSWAETLIAWPTITHRRMFLIMLCRVKFITVRIIMGFS